MKAFEVPKVPVSIDPDAFTEAIVNLRELAKYDYGLAAAFVESPKSDWIKFEVSGNKEGDGLIVKIKPSPKLWKVLLTLDSIRSRGYKDGQALLEKLDAFEYKREHYQDNWADIEPAVLTRHSQPKP